MASLAGLTTPIEPWGRRLLAQASRTNIGILRPGAANRYDCELFDVQAPRSVFLLEKGDDWHVCLGLAPMSEADMAQGVLCEGSVKMPLSGPAGFLFAFACGINHDDAADALCFDFSKRAHLAKIIVGHPVFQEHRAESEATLVNFAEAVTLRLRAELQAWSAEHPTATARALFEHFDRLVKRADAENAMANNPHAPQEAVEQARASAYCTITEALRFAPAFGKDYVAQYAAFQQALETQLW